MMLRLIKEEGNELSFILEGANPAYANSLRQAMMSEVPVLAIEEVEFRQNTSALYDEMIALRLGLIPLKTDLKSYVVKEECSCKGGGCAKCQVEAILNEEGPKVVRAGDLKFADPKVEPVFPEMPIVELLEGQKLSLKAIAVLGRGREHAKFAPCLATYRYYPKIKIEHKRCDACGRCVEACPKQVLELGEKVKVKKSMDCDLCNACVEACKKGAIKVEGDDTTFIFYIESWGQLPPKEIVEEGKEILQAKLELFLKLLKSPPESV